MTARKSITTIKLEDLSNEKLSKPIVNAIYEVRFEEWRNTSPTIKIEVNKTKIAFWIVGEISTKMTLIGLGSLISSAVVVIKFSYWLLPLLQNIHSGMP